MGRGGRKLAIAAGLLALGAVLQGLSMLVGKTPNTALDWVTLALLLAAAVGASINVMGVHRDDIAHGAEHQG